jgi:hypothetical protein
MERNLLDQAVQVGEVGFFAAFHAGEMVQEKEQEDLSGKFNL